MKRIALLVSLLVAASAAYALEETATSTVVTTPDNPAPSDKLSGDLVASKTGRNATGQIVWTCTYKLAATSKTVNFKNGCPRKLKFELTHRDPAHQVEETPISDPPVSEKK